MIISNNPEIDVLIIIQDIMFGFPIFNGSNCSKKIEPTGKQVLGKTYLPAFWTGVCILNKNWYFRKKKSDMHNFLGEWYVKFWKYISYLDFGPNLKVLIKSK